MKLDERYFAVDPEIKTKPIPGSALSFQKRLYPPFRLILHHSTGSKNVNIAHSVIVDQFSDVGYDRGYTQRNDKGKIIGYLPSFHIKANSNAVSYSQAHYALHKHDNNWCLVPLVKYPLSDICWHAGDTKWFPGTNKIHEESLGIEVCGNYEFEELELSAFDYLAEIFRPYSVWLREWLQQVIHVDSSYVPERELVVWGHKDFANTVCPGMIHDNIPYLRDKIAA